MQAITNRVVFLAGSKENSEILESLPQMAAAVRHGTAAITPNVGHGWAGENPELFARTIVAQLAGTKLPEELDVQPG